MKRSLLFSVAGTLLVAAALVASAEEAKPAYGEILKAKAPSLVSVKFVLKMRIAFGGQAQSEEMNREVTGVVVDGSGLVMISNTHLNVGMGRRGRLGGQASVNTAPSNFKVVFPGEEKEYEAILGATDSKLNLAFVKIKDLGEKKPAAVDFTRGAAVQIGQELVAVDRYGKGFDYAPTLSKTFVAGEILQPRHMYAVAGAGGDQGLPLFDASGQAVGVLAMQSGAEGAEEGGGGGLMGLFGGGGAMGVFLIPADQVQATIQLALKQAEEAMNKPPEDEGDGEEGDEEGDEEAGGEDE